MKPAPMHRSNRYRIQTKLDRQVQLLVESRRSRIRFTAKQPLPMIPYACNACHMAFATTWLDHCPACGTTDITVTPNLALAN